MSTSTTKKATSIRLDRDFYNYIADLAKKEHRSMNNLIEIALERALNYHIPNKETLEAMEEVEKYGDQMKSYSDAQSLFEDIENRND